MNIIKKILKRGLVLLLFVLASMFSIALTTSSPSGAQINFGDNPSFDLYGPGAKIIIVAPPGVFTLPESQTNITRVCTLGEALNIVLDVAGKNKIEFKEPIIDMCDKGTIENLDQRFQMDKVGEVTVDSNSLPYLKNKSALITMRGLPFEEEPDIEVDGRPATNQDIENKSWDQSSKTLTFEANHFTTYKAVAKSFGFPAIAEEEQIGEEQQPAPSRNISSFLSIGNIFLIPIIIAIILVVVGIVGYLVWRKKQSL